MISSGIKIDIEVLVEDLVRANGGNVPSKQAAKTGYREAAHASFSGRVAHESFHAALLADERGALDPDSGAGKIVKMFRSEEKRALTARSLSGPRAEVQKAIHKAIIAAGAVPTAATVDGALRYFLNERFASVAIAGSFSRGKTNEKAAREYAKVYLWNLGLKAPGEAKPHQKALEAGLTTFFNALDPSGSKATQTRPTLSERQQESRQVLDQLMKQALRHPF